MYDAFFIKGWGGYMLTVENKVEEVLKAQKSVIEKITRWGIESVIGDYIKKYHEAVEADVSRDYSHTLTESYKQVKEYLKALDLLEIARRF